MLDRKPQAPAHHRLAFLLLTCLPGLLVAARCGGGQVALPPPIAGAIEYQARALLGLEGLQGLSVNAAGGNLMLRRRDLHIDTQLGPYALGAVYNAGSQAGRGWQWSFELRYDGSEFVDDTGARHDLALVGDGRAVPGTHWRRVSAHVVATRGGLLYVFDPEHADLVEIRRRSAPLPRLVFVKEQVPALQGSVRRTDRIDQCTVQGCELVYDLEYDAQPGGEHRLLGVSDRAGRRTAYVYDAQGRLRSARDGLDLEQGWPGFRYEYHGDSRLLTALTSSEGERVELGYLPALPGPTNRIASVRRVGEEVPTWSFGYGRGEDGLFWTVLTDPTSATTRYVYDPAHRLQLLENGEKEVTRWEWSDRRPLRRTEPDGRVTRMSWGRDGLESVELPSGNTLRFSYAVGAVNRGDPLALPLRRVEDDLGVRLELEYDARGRAVAITNGAGETTRFSYGSDEMLASMTSPAGVRLELLDYGAHGRPTRLRRAGEEVSRSFDAVGNLLRGPDLGPDAAPGMGGVLARAFDADRNLRRVELVGDQANTDLRTGAIEIDHRSDGRRLRIRRPHGGDTLFLYDAIGRLVERRERVDATWRAYTIERDELGRPVAMTRANGMRTERGYDAAGRLERLRVLRDGRLESEATREFVDGRLVALHDSARGDAPQRFHYDGGGRVAYVEFPEGESLATLRDARGRVTSIALSPADGGILRVFSFAYDGAGREIEVRENGRLLIERLHQQGELVEMAFGNGLRRRFEHDPEHGTLMAATTLNAQGELLEESRFRLAAARCTLDTPCFEAATRIFGSEPAESLETYMVSLPGVADPEAGRRVNLWAGNETEAVYFYDLLSNLQFDGSQVREAIYNAERNRLQSLELRDGSRLEYEYDASGYVVRRGGVEISWDGAGRLRSVGEEGYGWDSFGRPLSRRTAGIDIAYRYGGLVQTTASGLPLAMDLGPVAIDLVSGRHRYRHLDFRGNVKFVSDDEGRIESLRSYAPYGIHEVHGGASAPRGFAGGSSVQGLTLLGHRLHDPVPGRFLAPDPVYQLINQYAYAMANPVQMWDPSGLEGRVLGFTAGEAARSVGLATTVAVAVAVAVAPPAAGPVSAVGGGLFSVFSAIDLVGGFPGDGNLGPDLNGDGFDANGSSGGGGGRGGGAGPQISGDFGSFSRAAGAARGAAEAVATVQLKFLIISVAGEMGLPNDGTGGRGDLSSGGFGSCAPANLEALPDLLPARVAMLGLLLLHAALGLVLWWHRRSLRRAEGLAANARQKQG